MARPRTPSKHLKLRGAFAINPSRSREDPPGRGPFGMPPAELDELEQKAWFKIESEVPEGLLTGSDRILVEMAACLLAEFWRNRKNLKVIREFRQYIGHLGLSGAARAKLDMPAKPKENPFSAFTKKAEAAAKAPH